MSLIKCKECGHEISKKAKVCPNCGAKNKARTSLFTWLVVLLIGLFVLGKIGGGNRTSTQSNANKYGATSSTSPQKNVNAAIPTVPVFKRVDTEIESLKFSKSKSYKEASVEEIIIHIAAFTARARLLEEAKKRASSDEQKKKVNILFDQVVALQKQELPKIRDAYGPALRRKLWEFDATAKTIGAGFRTIRLQARDFVANRNIKATQIEISNTLQQLRFSRAEYFWSESQKEYTYFDIDSHKDSKVINWVSESRYREVTKF